MGEVPEIPNEFEKGEMAKLKEYELQDPQLIIAAYENDASEADFEANLSLFQIFCTYFTNALSHDEEDEEGEEED